MFVNIILVILSFTFIFLIILFLTHWRLYLLGGVIAAMCLLASTILLLVYKEATPLLETVLFLGLCVSGIINIIVLNREGKTRADMLLDKDT